MGALESLIPTFTPSPKGGRRRTVDDRAALNGILYVLQTGIPWEDLAQELGFGSDIARGDVYGTGRPPACGSG